MTNEGDLVNNIPQGLTKREYIATLALEGLLSGNYKWYSGNADCPVPDAVASDAVACADALIKKLNES
jgi:hypothetical protein